LFQDFLASFSNLFSFENGQNKNQKSFYTWHDFVYRNFMMDLMQNLEPRFEKAGTILIDELDEVDEVLFFPQGRYEIGFEINGQKIFMLEYRQYNIIGAYYATFNQHSQEIYRTVTNCKGCFIRKQKWKELFERHPIVSETFKHKILNDFEKRIKFRINLQKQREIKKMKSRNTGNPMKYVFMTDKVSEKNNISTCELSRDESEVIQIISEKLEENIEILTDNLLP
jgi:hypothetical protein